MTVQLPTTLNTWLLVWAAAAILTTAFWCAAVEVAHTRELRRDKRALARTVGRILQDAARNANPDDLRSWR